MKRDIARLAGDRYSEQYNLKIDSDLKERLVRLKRVKRVDVSEEIRRKLAELADELEEIA